MQWIEIPKSYLTSPNQITLVKLPELNFCLIKNGLHWAAFAAKCPHAGALLSSGWCENGRIICSYHRHAFSLDSGRGDPGQGDYLKIFPLKEESNRLYIGLEKPWWKKIF